jgi:peptide/nickel transport system permease protein
MRRSGAYCSLAVGLLLLLMFAAFSLFPNVIAPYEVKEMFRAWLKPSADHLLGTNDMGYDIFTELVHAARNTLMVGLTAAVISLGIGTSIGILAGYLKGTAGEVLSGVINVFLLIPMLPAAIVAASFLGAGMEKIALVISLLGWCSTARAVRTRTVQLRQTPFVEQLIILQIPNRKILLRHILPNLADVALARGILSVSACMMTESALSFIGLGDPSSVTWGGMVNFAYRNGGFARGALNWFLAPGLCITLCALAFRLVCGYAEFRSGVIRNGDKKS